MVYPRVIGVAWFRAEDYQRIREISDDEMPATFEDWEAAAAKKFAAFRPPSVVVEKVIIDPDELAAYALTRRCRKIDAHVRAEFAAGAVAKKYAGARDH